MNRLRGTEIDSLADIALPFLLNLFAALAVGIVASAIDRASPVTLPWSLGLWALLFAGEGFLLTNLFFVRDHDRPIIFRIVEALLLLVLAKYLTTPGAGLPRLVAVEDLAPWLGVPLLAWAWFQGVQTARQAGALHPALQPDPSKEQIRQNDHGEAFGALRNRLLFTTLGVGAVVGILANRRTWDRLSLGVALLALLAAAALLVAAQLRQQATWHQERMVPPPSVLRRWIPQGGALLLLATLIALLLPAGPGLPLGQWIGRGQTEVTGSPVQPPAQPESDALADEREMLERLAAELPAVPRWLLLVPVLLGGAGLVALVGWLLWIALRQLAERLGSGEARGIWSMVTSLFRWYAALWQGLLEALRTAGRMAVTASSQAAGRVFGEAGLLTRLLPGRQRVPADPRRAVRFYFARLQAHAARKGLGRPPGVTAAEFAARLEAAAPEQAAEVAGLAQAYERARYSPEVVGPEQVSLARRSWLLIAKKLGRK